MHISGTWDIRATEDLRTFFRNLRTKGAYYWKLSVIESEQLIQLLCAAYNVPAIPLFIINDTFTLKQMNACGYCEWRDGNSIISTYPRPHFKTVAHEVYHHIDFYYRFNYRKRIYNSSDKKQYAWNFAEHLWKALSSSTPSVTVKSVAVHFHIFDSVDKLRAAFAALGGAKGWRKPTRIVERAHISALRLPSNIKRQTYILDNGKFLLQWIK